MIDCVYLSFVLSFQEQFEVFGNLLFADYLVCTYCLLVRIVILKKLF